MLSHISTSLHYDDLADCDLVIETVPEDRAIKSEVIRKARAVLNRHAVFASNTSTFPITSLAATDERPADFIGVHFFSPVDKMGLVELVLGQKTSRHALAVAFDYGRALGKTPIVVNDGYQFFANRCVNHYLREGHLMLYDGVPAELIETAASQAGMPVGPLALSDEIAIDLVYKILLLMKAELSPQAIDQRQESLLRTLVETHRRRGRKAQKGFYDYPEAQPKALWAGLSKLPSSIRDADTIDPNELKLRFLAIQALEAIRAVEEGIVCDPREADVGSVLGFGFPAVTGGVLSYIDGMGTASFAGLCEALAAVHGERFSPPMLLKDLARRSASVYEHFANKS
jgi:3-hydroxyacyl-CoA dehydrogenase/enoyl-CoA hydratase/3-hydroxybutyryl-CoA epimerase